MPGLMDSAKNILTKGKSAINNFADSVQVVGANPGHAFNKTISSHVRHPVTAGLNTAIDTSLQSVGVNLPPGMSVPGVDKIGNAIEGSIMSKGTRLGLARRAENYMKSPAAGKVETVFNKVFNVGTNIAGAMGAGF